MTWIRVLFVVAILGVITGCNRAATNEPAPPVNPREPVRAQPKLRTTKLWLGSEELVTELALTPSQVQTGMMFRTNMAENEAMLFVFSYPHRAGFWMKNTYVPLSAAYIDPEGIILEIHDLHPQNTNTVLASSSDVHYVLETRQGWFERHKVGVGTVVRTELGTLRETFFASRRPR